jgi:hypothetical protein
MIGEKIPLIPPPPPPPHTVFAALEELAFVHPVH